MTAFRIPVALLCAAGLALFTPSPALAQKIKPGGGQTYPYTLVDLLGAFRPTGGYQSSASALCEPDVTGSLLIVGHTHVPSPQPALWDDIGQMAGSINGQAAMAAFDDNNILQIVRIGPSYSLDFNSQATAIRADGRWLAGHFDHRVDGNMLQEAFAWHVTDGFLSLGTLNGVGQSWASGVNSSGQVVGTSTVTGRMPQAAFLWQNGTMTNLNSLVATGGKYLQLGNRINEHGDIVGLLRIGKPVSEIHAFLLIPQAQ